MNRNNQIMLKRSAISGREAGSIGQAAVALGLEISDRLAYRQRLYHQMTIIAMFALVALGSTFTVLIYRYFNEGVEIQDGGRPQRTAPAKNPEPEPASPGSEAVYQNNATSSESSGTGAGRRQIGGGVTESGVQASPNSIKRRAAAQGIDQSQSIKMRNGETGLIAAKALHSRPRRVFPRSGDYYVERRTPPKSQNNGRRRDGTTVNVGEMRR